MNKILLISPHLSDICGGMLEAAKRVCNPNHDSELISFIEGVLYAQLHSDAMYEVTPNVTICNPMLVPIDSVSVKLRFRTEFIKTPKIELPDPFLPLASVDNRHYGLTVENGIMYTVCYEDSELLCIINMDDHASVLDPARLAVLIETEKFWFQLQDMIDMSVLGLPQ